MSQLEIVRHVIRIAASSYTAASILNHFANRRRGRKAETVRRLMQVCGGGTSRGAVVAVLRQLETFGFGKLVVGRHGHETRFEWAEV